MSGAGDGPVLRSAGAAGTVTGSCHHLTYAGARLLVDCGAFQGPADLEARNREAWPFDVAALDAVVLTHAHLDHVGRLPHLVRAGFAGPVLAAPGTKAVADVILRDAAKIAREDAERARRKARRAGREGSVPPPPFDEADVDATLAAFRTVAYDDPVEIAGLRVTLHPAGHVVGSAWVAVDGPEGRIVLSGDLGNRESLLHPAPAAPTAARAVVCEATYGDRTHRSREATRAEFADVLAKAASTGGRVLIPSFALERTQAVLFEIHRLQREGTVPAVPVVLDSPMASRMTAIYRDHAADFRPEVRALAGDGDPFTPLHFEATADPDASRALNDREGPMIVVAGSGMMTGGRILHHLKHHLWKRETHVVVVGYQARGTLGRALVGGATHVRIFGEAIAVRGRIHTIGGLSAHADRDDLLAWLAPVPDAKVRLVHGEPDALEAFATTLRDRGYDAAPVEEGRATPL